MDREAETHCLIAANGFFNTSQAQSGLEKPMRQTNACMWNKTALAGCWSLMQPAPSFAWYDAPKPGQDYPLKVRTMWKLQGEQGICLMIEKRREALLCNARFCESLLASV